MVRNLIATEYDDLTLSDRIDALDAARRLAVEHVQSVSGDDEFRTAAVTDVADYLTPDYYETYVVTAEDWDRDTETMITYSWPAQDRDTDPRVDAFRDAWMEEAQRYAEMWKAETAKSVCEKLGITEADLNGLYQANYLGGRAASGSYNPDAMVREIEQRFSLPDGPENLGDRLYEAGILDAIEAAYLNVAP